MSEENTFYYKVLLLGDHGKGKIKFFRFLDPENKNTGKFVSVDEKFLIFSFKFGKIDIKFMILTFDVEKAHAHQAKFGKIYYNRTRVFHLGTLALLIIFDLDNKTSFENFPKWVEGHFEIISDRIPIVLIGYKENNQESAVSNVQIKNYVRKLSEWLGFVVPYIELDNNVLNEESIRKIYFSLVKRLISKEFIILSPYNKQTNLVSLQEKLKDEDMSIDFEYIDPLYKEVENIQDSKELVTRSLQDPHSFIRSYTISKLSDKDTLSKIIIEDKHLTVRQLTKLKLLNLKINNKIN